MHCAANEVDQTFPQPADQPPFEAVGLRIADCGLPWRSFHISTTELIGQVWARDCGFRSKVIFSKSAVEEKNNYGRECREKMASFIHQFTLFSKKRVLSN
ncbi:MAG: hypothetical protein BA861_12445 [Desulfobacterales bacterium S3730MH5]|nr:MAG: hypothetical protein BA861_12445 [Desulfobacterales bacterium S3730MH5]